MRGEMGDDLYRLREDRLDLLLEELAYCAPSYRQPGNDFRLALAQRAAGLLRHQHDVVVLEQHMALAVFQHIEAAEPRNAQDAVVIGRRTEQIELRIIVFSHADLPASDVAARNRSRAGVGELG